MFTFIFLIKLYFLRRLLPPSVKKNHIAVIFFSDNMSMITCVIYRFLTIFCFFPICQRSFFYSIIYYDYVSRNRKLIRSRTSSLVPLLA